MIKDLMEKLGINSKVEIDNYSFEIVSPTGEKFSISLRVPAFSEISDSLSSGVFVFLPWIKNIKTGDKVIEDPTEIYSFMRSLPAPMVQKIIETITDFATLNYELVEINARSSDTPPA